MTAPVALCGVGHSYGKVPALAGIDLAVGAGEYVALLGPSGCGKSTLLSILGGFVTPTEGAVRIADRDVTRVPPARRPTATMFQDYALFPHMCLRDNVAFGLRMRGIGRRERHRRADAQLDMVGLLAEAGKRPHALSGGQRQRVALARALAVEPDVLLLDEPLGALDLALRRAMQDELKAVQRRVGTTFIHVTHDQEEAMAIADRIVVMDAGRIEDEGPPARVYRRPATLFAAAFMGETNRVPARAEGGRVVTPFGALPLEAPRGTDVPCDLTLCLRPEALRIARPGDGDLALGPCEVLDAAFFGAHVRARLRPRVAPDLILVAHLPTGAPPARGEVVDLAADPADAAVFPA
jgi:spermidine/putrescine transport system ATP-binding protein